MDRNARAALLRASLAVCPTDIVARGELALILEELGQIEEALASWKTLLTADPNNLRAREGVARCQGRQAVRRTQANCDERKETR